MPYAKKSLGQHFLKDENVAQKIVSAFLEKNPAHSVIEIGPGQGVLTKYLLDNKELSYYGVELDQRMIPVLLRQFPQIEGRIFNEDVLDFDWRKAGTDNISIIGNFPYNISSQILFKVLDNKELVNYLVGMFQKEVAKRISALSGNKEYGILSVLMQTYYDIEYLFDVGENSFSPPPRVTSGVIRLVKKQKLPVIYREDMYRMLVKSGFGQRRKTLRNSLAHMVSHVSFVQDPVFDKRAEQLSVAEWIKLSNRITES